MQRYLYILAITFFIFSCSKKSNNEASCGDTSIIVVATSTNTSNSSSTGTISVTQPISSEYTYRLNSGAYQSSPNFINLAPGTYTVTAKNAAGCTGATSVVITGNDCNGTVINVQTSATTNSITVTSPLGSNYSYSINAGTFQSSPVFNGLASGTYTVIAKNQYGCTGATSAVVTNYNCSGVNINVQGNTTSSSITITNPLGGNYTYSLNGGAYQSSPVFSGLAYGTYSVTAKDQNGCTGSNAFTISSCYSINGKTDTGAHKIYIGSLAAPLDPIRDNLSLTVSGSLLNIHSTALGRYLTGTVNCNAITLDSVIFAPNDTLVINSTTLGRVTIYNMRAGGNGTISSNGISTKINIVKGNTNITSPINLTNLTGLGLNLQGTFLHLP